MSKDLYFISIIARAIQQSDPKTVLKQAFAEIERLGRQTDYQQGYLQFQQFMQAAASHAESRGFDLSEQQIVDEVIAELATDTFEGNPSARQAAIELIRSNPTWQEQYDRLRTELEETTQPIRFPEIVVSRDQTTIGTISLRQLSGCGAIENISPGDYTLTLNTGRLIWQGVLTDKDLLWNIAFPGQPLDLAADTEVTRRPTREEILLDGELVLRVFPGPESGWLEIEARASGAGEDDH